MGTIRIAHISDLHFGAENQAETWSTLKEHLSQTENGQPLFKLVLVTGDIANTNDLTLLQRARAELDSLGINYFVCPGNHDRHPLGNYLRVKAAELWNRVRGRESSAFDQAFQGLFPVFPQFKDYGLTHGTDQWVVRIAGVDSSIHADISARGLLPPSDQAALRRVMYGENADNVDLGILMVHHHLLPIRSLEQNVELTDLNWKSLANLTTLVNAGSVMELLASSHFDLVLHGHEHASNWGRYGTLADGGGQIAVIAAASGTGTITSEPCSTESVSYNVIALRPDRSVELFIMGYANRDWKTLEHLEIMSAEDLRRQRFLRAAASAKLPPPRLAKPDFAPTAEIVKVMEFTREGHGIIHQEQTYWTPETNNEWRLLVRNSTGEPDSLRVRFIAGNEPFDTEPKFHRSQEPYVWEASHTLDDDFFKRHSGEIFRVEEAYRWRDGAILTSGAMGNLLADKSRHPGPFRVAEREFAEASITRWFTSLILIVQLPSEFAPDPNTLEVTVQKDGTPVQNLAVRPEIKRCLRILGPGLYSLIVPYPIRGYRYGLSWSPPSVSEPLATRL